MKLFLLLSFYVMLTSAGFPSLSTVFPFLRLTPTRRPLLIPQSHPHHRREFGKRTSEDLNALSAAKESVKRRKFHLQLSFGPLIVPSEGEGSTTTVAPSYYAYGTPTPSSGGWQPPTPSGGYSVAHGIDINDSAEYYTHGWSTSAPYTQPAITWRTVKPTYRTTTTTEPYESEEEVLPGGFTTTTTRKPTTTRTTTPRAYRTTTSTTTTTEPYESEEEILPGGQTEATTRSTTSTTTLETEEAVEAAAAPAPNPIFEKIKETLPKIRDWKLSLLPKLPKGFHFPVLTKGVHVKGQKHTSTIQEIFPNLHDWTDLLPSAIRTPRNSKEVNDPATSRAMARADVAESRQLQTDPPKKSSRKKPKDVYIPPAIAITLTPPSKKPTVTPKPRQNSNKKRPGSFEEEEDIQPGGQKPKPTSSLETYRAKPAKPAKTASESEEDIQAEGRLPGLPYDNDPDRGYNYPAPKPPSKEVYFFVPPKEFNPKKPKPRTTQAPLKPKKQVKVIFIKTPDPEPPIIPDIPAIPPNPEQKTLIYVVGKKPDDTPNVTITLPAETKNPKPNVYYVRYQVTTTEPPAESEEDIQAAEQTPPKGYSYPKPKRTPRPAEDEEEILPGGFTTKPRPRPKSRPKPVYLPPDESEEDIQPGGQLPMLRPTYLPPVPDESEEDIQPGGQTEAPTTTTTMMPTTTTQMPTTTMPAESEEDIQPGGQTEGPATTPMPTTTPAPAYLPPAPHAPPSAAYLPLPPAKVVQPPPGGAYLPVPPPVPSGGYNGGYEENYGGFHPPYGNEHAHIPGHAHTHTPAQGFYGHDYGASVTNYLNDHNNPYFAGPEDDDETDEYEDEDGVGVDIDLSQGHGAGAGYPPYGPNYHLPGDPYGSNEWNRQLIHPRRKKKSKYGQGHYDLDRTRDLQFSPYEDQSPQYDSSGRGQYRRPRKGRAGGDYRKKNKSKQNFGAVTAAGHHEGQGYAGNLNGQKQPKFSQQLQYGHRDPHLPILGQEHSVGQSIEYIPGSQSREKIRAPNSNSKESGIFSSLEFNTPHHRNQFAINHNSGEQSSFQEFNFPKFNSKVKTDHSTYNYNAHAHAPAQVTPPKYSHSQETLRSNAQKFSANPIRYEAPKFNGQGHSQEQGQFGHDHGHGLGFGTFVNLNPQQQAPSPHAPSAGGLYTVDPLRLQHPQFAPEPLTQNFNDLQYDPLKFAIEELDKIPKQFLSNEQQNYNTFRQGASAPALFQQQHNPFQHQGQGHAGQTVFDGYNHHSSQNFTLPLHHERHSQFPPKFGNAHAQSQSQENYDSAQKYFQGLSNPHTQQQYTSQEYEMNNLGDYNPGLFKAPDQGQGVDPLYKFTQPTTSTHFNRNEFDFSKLGEQLPNQHSHAHAQSSHEYAAPAPAQQHAHAPQFQNHNGFEFSKPAFAPSLSYNENLAFPSVSWTGPEEVRGRGVRGAGRGGGMLNSLFDSLGLLG